MKYHLHITKKKKKYVVNRQKAQYVRMINKNITNCTVFSFNPNRILYMYGNIH